MISAHVQYRQYWSSALRNGQVGCKVMSTVVMLYNEVYGCTDDGKTVIIENIWSINKQEDNRGIGMEITRRLVDKSGATGGRQTKRQENMKKCRQGRTMMK